MKQLLEDYKNRLMHADKMLKTTSNTGSENHIRKIERLKTKCSCYRSIIAELERERQALKAPEMCEALKAEIELLKIDLKFHSSKIMIDGYQSRINKLESLINELES